MAWIPVESLNGTLLLCWEWPRSNCPSGLTTTLYERQTACYTLNPPPQPPLSGLHPGRWKCNKEENSLVSINEGLKWSPYLMTFISSSHSSWVASSWLNERVVRAKCWFNKWKEPLGPCSVPDVGSQAVFFTDAFHSPDRVMRNLSHRYFKRNGFLVNSISFL